MRSMRADTMSGKLYAWFLAARLRTLPLACASILLGAGLAASQGDWDGRILGLALLTAVLLQVLSNFANDFGDAGAGTDGEARVGPVRAVASGMLSPRAMLLGIVLAATGAALSGLLLLFVALGGDWPRLLLFVALGSVAILAAIPYTVGFGHAPYGYRALGDLSVFLFFGLLGVLGSYYLFTLRLEWPLLMPAAACGLLATAVLNVNNVRDIDSDAASGKITVAVRLGRRRALRYHWGLLGLALLLTLAFLLQQRASLWAWSCLLAAKPLVDAGRTLGESRDGDLLTGMLKKTVIGTLLYSVLLAAGLALP